MSGFTSFLKKLGQITLTVAQDASAAIPLLQPLQMFLPKPIQGVIQRVESVGVDKLQAALNLSQQVEKMFTAASGGQSGLGSQKVAAMVPDLTGLFQSLEVIGGKTVGQIIKDPAAFNAAMATIAGGIGQALNACGD